MLVAVLVQLRVSKLGANAEDLAACRRMQLCLRLRLLHPETPRRNLMVLDQQSGTI